MSAFTEAAGATEVAGPGGRLVTYRCFVHESLPVATGRFALAVDRALLHARSWIASGEVRFQRVSGQASSLGIYLAPPGVADEMCAPLNTHGYLSCRQDDKVILNSDRWAQAVPHWGQALAAYRRYLVNHEVGHFLGLADRECSCHGCPSPVMAQQTKTLGGCTETWWPLQSELEALANSSLRQWVRRVEGLAREVVEANAAMVTGTDRRVDDERLTQAIGRLDAALSSTTHAQGTAGS
jgi:Protein of unknown function (DUF3152)